MKSIYKILCICCMIVPVAMTAQVVTVVDKDTEEPIEFVSIFDIESSQFVTTNAAGQANMTAFAGADKIEFRYLGYSNKVMSFEELSNIGFRVVLEPSSVFLDPVVISDSRWREKARDVPVRIASITARDVALQNPQTAADMLWASGEVFIQKSQQGGGSPMIRGFATNRLLYAVDGVRMNTAIFRSGNIQNVISLDPFATENAEVLFGPGSIIYGSDAIGGVMSFSTLTPQFSFSDDPLISGAAVARYATANNEKTAHMHVNMGWNKWASVTSFSSNDYGDLRMGSHGPDEYLKPYYVERVDSIDRVVTNPDPEVQVPSGYKQINLMQKLRFKPSEAWDFELGLHYSTTTDYPRYDRLLRLRNGLPRSAEWDYGPQVWFMGQLSATHSAQTGIYDQLSIRLAYQLFEESRKDRDFNNPIRYIREEEVGAYSANLDFVKALRGGDKVFYGVEAVIDDVDSRGSDVNIETGASETGPSRYPQSIWASYAVYGKYEHSLSEVLKLQGALRYNYFNLDADFANNLPFYPLPFETAEIKKGALIGSLGTVWHPEESMTISAHVSTGFRAPNVDDIGKIFDSTPGSVVVPNPGLEPEYAYNAELGFAKVFGERLRLDLSAYYTLLDNAMVRRNYTINGMDSIIYDGELSQVEAVQNAAQATVFGIQAGVEIKFGGGFSLLSRFNLQDGEEELDDGSTSPLRHAAPWYGVTRLVYSNTKLNMQLYAMYSGEVSYDNLSQDSKGTPFIFALDENGNPYSPSWITLNFKVSAAINSFLTVTGGVENFTDLRYRPYSSGITAPGRNVILALRAKF